MGTPYQMQPKKKMSKGALWGIIGGKIGLVVIIVGVVLAVLLLGGPSKADYKAAGEKLNDVIKSIQRDFYITFICFYLRNQVFVRVYSQETCFNEGRSQ